MQFVRNNFKFFVLFLDINRICIFVKKKLLRFHNKYLCIDVKTCNGRQKYIQNIYTYIDMENKTYEIKHKI